MFETVILKVLQEKVRHRMGFFAFALLCCYRCAVHASSFEDANQLYYEGKFSDAASAYEKLIQSGMISPALYFNLGNAWFKSGQVGRAISAYQQAERYTPRDPDLRANLNFARNQTQGPTMRPSALQRSLHRLTLNEWTLLASGSIWVGLLLLSVTQWRPGWTRNLRVFLVCWGSISLCLCVSLGMALYQDHSIQRAVVISSQAVVRKGPLDVSQNAFTLHDGAEVRVLDRKEDWLLVSTDPQRTGWLRRDQVLLASK
jgi:tetratricopeptide (TPR) repeat protein